MGTGFSAVDWPHSWFRRTDTASIVIYSMHVTFWLWDSGSVSDHADEPFFLLWCCMKYRFICLRFGFVGFCSCVCCGGTLDLLIWLWVFSLAMVVWCFSTGMLFLLLWRYTVGFAFSLSGFGFVSGVVLHSWGLPCCFVTFLSSTICLLFMILRERYYVCVCLSSVVQSGTIGHAAVQSGCHLNGFTIYFVHSL